MEDQSPIAKSSEPDIQLCMILSDKNIFLIA